jgi:hypothetical protein
MFRIINIMIHPTDLFVDFSSVYVYVNVLGTNEQQHVLVIRKYVVANTYYSINTIALYRARLRQSMTITTTPPPSRPFLDPTRTPVPSDVVMIVIIIRIPSSFFFFLNYYYFG